MCGWKGGGDNDVGGKEMMMMSLEERRWKYKGLGKDMIMMILEERGLYGWGWRKWGDNDDEGEGKELIIMRLEESRG